MKLVSIKCLIFLGIFSLQPTVWADTNSNKMGNMEIQTAETIRNIGRNILAAKHSEEPDKDLSQMRLALEELRTAVKALHVNGVSTEASVAGSPSPVLTGDSDPQINTKRELSNKRKPFETEVKAVLGRMRTQRSKFEASVETTATPKREHKKRLAGTIKDLEDELSAILDLPKEVQSEKLTNFHKRLEIHKGIDNGKPEETPTISTIVTHRE